MNTTNSLRWRARVTKEAFLHNDNDNSHYTDRWETDDSHSTLSTTHPTKPTRRRRVTTICIDTFALTAVGASIYVLLQWSLIGLTPPLLSFVGRVLLVMACSLTLILASLVMQQERKQRRFGMLRQVYFATKRTVRSLQQQNERLCRSLTALDRTVDRMHLMEQELKQYTKSTTDNNHYYSTLQSIQVIQEYMQIQRRLNEQLHYQIEEQILLAVMQHKKNQDHFDMSATELERFIVQLNNRAGIVLVQEANVREILVSRHDTEDDVGESNDTSSRFTIPLKNVLILLRRLRKDVQENNTSANRTTTPTNNNKRNQGGIWLDDDDGTTLFQFQPRVLLPSTKDLMEF